jgi:lysozyme
MNKALGVDVSFYQAEIDWEKCIAAGANFAFIRAGQNIVTDKCFYRNWDATNGKIPRGAYWFYDWRSTGATASAQGKAFAATVEEVGELPPVMDFEVPWSGWSSNPFPSRTAAIDIMQRFQQAVGKPMILYTNSSTLKALTPFPDWLTRDWLLWVAAWPYAANTSPSRQCKTAGEIPAAWTPATYGWNWTFWQFTSKLDGKTFGTQTFDLDGDLYNGSDTELRQFAGVEGVPPAPELTDAEKLRRLWDVHPELH